MPFGIDTGGFDVRGLGTGGNWFNTRERIKLELHRNRAVEENQIELAMITACEFYRWHRLYFNEGSASMFTRDGVSEYGESSRSRLGNGWPSDLLEIDNQWVFQNEVQPPLRRRGAPTIVNTDPGNAYRMHRDHIDTLRDYIDSAGDSESRPYIYAWHHETMLLYPVPDTTYRIRIDYLRDLDFPKAQIVSGEWKFFSRSNGAPVDDDYNSPWLFHAEELIRNRAKADLWANVYYQSEQAGMAREQEREAYRNLARATSKRLSTGMVRPFLPGVGSGLGGYGNW